MTVRCLFALAFVLAVCVSSIAQPSDASKMPPKTAATNAKPGKDPEAERMVKERRDNAQNLLINLAAEAGRFNDQTLRARTQARIADVLWSGDQERAKALFRKAWESAEIVDQETQRKLQEDVKQQIAKNGSAVVAGSPNIRAEVLRLAAKHDRTLGEEFLAKLRTQQQQDATDNTDRNRNNISETPEAVSQRLNLARQLLDTDVARALQFADPALMSLTREGIDFLSYLREQDARAADLRYSAFLARADADLQSDANTVSLLSSYVFTPHMFVSFSNNGSTKQSTGPSTGPVNVPADLRSAFFRVAGDILLRPLPLPEQDQTSSGVQGKYLMLKRLGPLFDQYAPKDLADAIRAQTDALAQGLPDDVRQRDDDPLRDGIRPPQDPADREKALQDRIDRAKTSDERDALNIQLAQIYLAKPDIRAREYVDKIEDTELRDKVRPYIDGSLAMQAVDKKNLDLLLDVLKKGELAHLNRSWALLQAAKLISKSDRERALATIDEAAAEARRLEESDPDRPRALTAVANALLPFDRAKAWDAAAEAVKAANAAENFTGEDGAIRFTMSAKNWSSARSSSVAEFNVGGIFSDLAKEDYNKAVEIIRAFQHEAPRASATIAIARAILEDKKN